MNHKSDETPNLPIQCTLTPSEIESRRDRLLPGLLSKANAQEQIPGGFRWRFAFQPGFMQEAAAVIDAEHACCRFLRFLLQVEPGDGPVWLEVTGPEGTQDFLTTLVDDPGPSERKDK